MEQKINLLYLCKNPADDNDKRISHCLDTPGYDFFLERVSSAQDALDKLAKHKIDVILLDGLPGDAFQFADKIHPPFIAIIESNEEETAIAALEQGNIADYIIHSQSGFKRLPLVVRAALARERDTLIQSDPDLDRLQKFTELRRGYDALVVVDRTGRVIHQAQDSLSKSGYSWEELKNMNPFDLVHRSDVEAIMPVFASLATNPGEEKVARVRFLQKDGSWHWYDVMGTNMLEDPLVKGILIRFNDITKRKQDELQQEAVYRITQAALSSMSLGDLFSSIHLIIAEIMPASNFYLALYDSKNELLEFPYYQDENDTPPSGPVKLGHGLTEYVIRTGRTLLCNQEVSDRLEEQDEVDLVGSPSAIWLGVPLLIGQQVIGVMVVQDYNDEKAYGTREQKLFEFVSSQVASAIFRKQAEAELRESEIRFRSLFENSTIGIYRSTPDGRLLLVNPALLRISGYESLDEVENIDLTQSGYVNPDERKQFQMLLEMDGEVRGIESAWRKKDGSAIFVRESARLIRNELTGEIYYEGIVEDITERKKAELALKEKITALETLAEIDNEILLAKNSVALLEMVCRRAVDLLSASKACIASISGNRGVLLAIHGFHDTVGANNEFSNTLSLRVFNRRSSFVIRNLGDNNFPSFMMKTRKKENIHSAIADSFRAGGNFQAVLIVFDKIPRNWSEDDQQLLRFLAGQVALSLERTRLLVDAEKRAQNFETLYSLGREVASRRDFESVLDFIVKSVIRLLRTQCGFIYLYNEEKDHLELTIIDGVDLERGFVLNIGEGLAGRVAKTSKPRRVDDYRRWRQRNRSLDNFDFSAMIAVPMIYSGQLIGVLSVSELGNAQRTFSDEDVRLLTLIAGQAASAVFNARLFSQIKQRNEELDRLYRSLGLLIAGISSDRSRLCQHISEIVVSEFNQTNCSVWLLKEDDTFLERCGLSGMYTNEVHLLPLIKSGESLIPSAMREGRIINIGDVRGYGEYLPSWKNAASELVVPLMVEQKVIGVIDLQSPKPYAFGDDDERLMSLFALRAALILDHARLIEQTEERNRRLGALHVIETAITSSLDLRITLSTLVEQIQARLGVDAVSVLILDQGLQVLEYVVGRGFHNTKIEQIRIRVGEDIPGLAALDREIVYVSDLTHPKPALQYPERIASEEFVTTFALPLVTKGQLYGVLELFYRKMVHNNFEWEEFLETLARQVAMAIDGIYVFDQLQQSLMIQQAAQDATLESWARLLEMRGLEPKGHSKRVTVATINLAQQLGISDPELVNIHRGALLHDIGKLLLPDAINQNSGPLLEAEWALVRQHPKYAYDLLAKIKPLKAAISIPYCHHEHWDGSGYPRGLKGEQIPIEARIFRIVETYDLMLVDLPYRKAFFQNDVIDYLKSQAGKIFDSQIIDKFLAMTLY